ncbi:hypothetical protein [Xenorhabdus santafensis]|uniref:hypothetical protein n=1 Tax=Xenorhabdus santafensis TaxID=2582833 RepID=UPI0029E814B2|nr:hypothetical protein [Xenorhabdus sp. 12]
MRNLKLSLVVYKSKFSENKRQSPLTLTDLKTKSLLDVSQTASIRVQTRRFH